MLGAVNYVWNTTRTLDLLLSPAAAVDCYMWWYQYSGTTKVDGSVGNSPSPPLVCDFLLCDWVPMWANQPFVLSLCCLIWFLLSIHFHDSLDLVGDPDQRLIISQQHAWSMWLLNTPDSVHLGDSTSVESICSTSIIVVLLLSSSSSLVFLVFLLLSSLLFMMLLLFLLVRYLLFVCLFKINCVDMN